MTETRGHYLENMLYIQHVGFITDIYTLFMTSNSIELIFLGKWSFSFTVKQYLVSTQAKWFYFVNKYIKSLRGDPYKKKIITWFILLQPPI
jgi:hypothetical protein